LQQFRYNFVTIISYTGNIFTLKKLLFTLLFSSALYSQSHFYFGTSAGAFHESFVDQDNVVLNTVIANFKMGYGQQKAYAIEFSFDYTKNDSRVFSSTTTNDGDKYGFNLNLVKSFDYNIFILPFIKAGFGTGFLEIERSLQKKLSYGSYNLAGGIFIPLNKTFDLELGYEYRYTSYQAINTIAQRIHYKSHVSVLYSGINYRF
jgi:opacity protein-like surface antigen